MNRIDRVTAILIQLQSKRVVKAQDIAERFGISLRTVYRDVRTLEEAGIPIIGEAGVGYSIMDGYRLPPVMFTTDEATAFLTAEKLIEKLTDPSTGENYKSAMFKIRSVLKSSEKDFLENIEGHIEVIRSNHVPQTPNETGCIPTILKSISGKNILSLQYFAQHSQENTQREVEPVGIFYLGLYWHLIAYCRLRKDYRDFRIDRISGIRITEQVFNPHQHPTLQVYLKQMSREKEMHTVIMRVQKETTKYFGDQKYYNGFVSQTEDGDWMEMTFLSGSLEGFARWYMMFGDRAEIVEPVSLKERVKEIAGQIVGKA
jgi:predicted DNA-binding transcriptional regulator YafY